MVIWLIGISGAGKTTLARGLSQYFCSKKSKNYLIDGDEVRDFFENDLGYTQADRELNIKRILFGAYLLDKNDVVTIVANISPFEHLREMARNKILGYHEIYLKKELDVSIENDVKGVYRKNLKKSALVGVDIAFDPPQKPNLVIPVDEQTPDESLQMIIKYLEEQDD